MLIVDGTMVYEIDEECISKRTPPKECGVMEELEKKRGDCPALPEGWDSKSSDRIGF
jgi:hypothetical protein